MSVTAVEKQRIIEVYRELKATLVSFEVRYSMSSEDFYDKFQNWLLPEREEYFRWRVDYVGLMHIEKSHPWLIEDK